MAARSLDVELTEKAAGNYVGMRIVHDPNARFAFQFRHDASSSLARFTTDSRFIAIEGGVPSEELQPIFDAWWARFVPRRLVNGGSVSQFAGTVEFDMTIDEAAFQVIAAEQGWVLPPRIRLHFPPPRNPRPVDPALTHLVRVFPREERSPGAVPLVKYGGRLILRDGCFRIEEPGDTGPLVLFSRGSELGLDSEGYIAVGAPLAMEGWDRGARVGERVSWAGPRSADETDEGVKALRAACGKGEVIPVGAVASESLFDWRSPPGG